MSVRTGILGVGFMGRVHAGILRRDRRVEPSGVFDVDRQRGEEAAKELNCTLARTGELFERVMPFTSRFRIPCMPRRRPALQPENTCSWKSRSQPPWPKPTVSARGSGQYHPAGQSQPAVRAAYQTVKDCLKAEDIEPTLAHFK
jgi:hypothetical protein